VDSKNHIWIATWGSRGMQEGALYGLNPETGEVLKRKLDIAFSNPYTVSADERDDIWIGTDNYLVRYDQKADGFTRYPLTVRTDIPKITIAQGSAIWFTPRNAGHFGGYGGSASVLYPDKDDMKTLAAYFHDSSTENRLKYYKGPAGPKVTGVEKISPCGAQNPGEFVAVMDLDDDLTACKGTTGIDVYE
jgi:streptogramin lyase